MLRDLVPLHGRHNYQALAQRHALTMAAQPHLKWMLCQWKTPIKGR